MRMDGVDWTKGIKVEEDWFDVKAEITVGGCTVRIEEKRFDEPRIVQTYGYCTKRDVSNALAIYNELDLEPKIKNME